MSLSDWGVLVSIVLAIGGVTALGIKWTIKHYLSELKPNGGSSLNDKIKLEVLPLLGEIKVELAEMRGRFDQHIDEGK